MKKAVLFTMSLIITMSIGISAYSQGQRAQIDFLEKDLLKDVIEIKGVDAGDKEFPRGFAIEIKNVGTKPIYGVYAFASFPETDNMGMSLYFGDPKYIGLGPEFAVKNDPKASVLQPGESFTLKPTAAQERDYARDVFKHARSNAGRVVVTFQQINFGDGTGRMLGHPDQIGRAHV